MQIGGYGDEDESQEAAAQPTYKVKDVASRYQVCLIFSQLVQLAHFVV